MRLVSYMKNTHDADINYTSDTQPSYIWWHKESVGPHEEDCGWVTDVHESAVQAAVAVRCKLLPRGDVTDVADDHRPHATDARGSLATQSASASNDDNPIIASLRSAAQLSSLLTR